MAVGGEDAGTGRPVRGSGSQRLFKPAMEIDADHSPEITSDLLHLFLSDNLADGAIGPARLVSISGLKNS